MPGNIYRLPGKKTIFKVFCERIKILHNFSTYDLLTNIQT